MISCTEHLLIRVGERNPELQRTSPTFLMHYPFTPVLLMHHCLTGPPISRKSRYISCVYFRVVLGLSPNLFTWPRSATFSWTSRGSARLCLAAARSSRTCGEAPHSASVTGHLAWFLGTSLGCGGAYSWGSSLLFPLSALTAPRYR